jgi:hypothetical protein
MIGRYRIEFGKGEIAALRRPSLSVTIACGGGT